MLQQSGTKMEELIHLENGNLEAQVYKGQLVSFSKNGIEYVHGGGKPDKLKSPADRIGWNKSEIFMFPVTGPVYTYKVQVGDAFFPQDQHGTARLISFNVLNVNADSVSLIQVYDGRKRTNPKHETNPKSPEHLIWLPYTLEKTIKLQNDHLKATFILTNTSNEVMPYMFGWHPTFKAPLDGKDGVFEANHAQYSLEKIIELEPKGGLLLPGVDSIRFTDKKTGQFVEVLSEGFGNMMLWSPGKESSQVCIEPVTHLPVLDGQQNYFSSGIFEQLEPQQQKTYSVVIKI